MKNLLSKYLLGFSEKLVDVILFTNNNSISRQQYLVKINGTVPKWHKLNISKP